MELQAIDYGRKWHVMAAVGMGVLLATVDGSIVNVALPTLVRELDTDFATVQWVVLAYLLTLAALMVGLGRLSDMIGKKPIYTAGFGVFTVGSVLCGFSPTVYWLIGLRVLQAVGAAMIVALGMAIVTESFPPAERGRAIGIAGSIISLGIVVGPTLGGLLIDALSWHWIFFVNLPVGILGTVMASRFVSADRPAGGEIFDLPGAAALVISLLSLLLALTSGQRWGFGDSRILALLAVWVLFLVAFLIVERRSPHPMVDLRLFQSSLFSVGLTTGFLTFVCIASTVILMPFYLQNVLGYPVREVGVLMAVVPVALAVIAPLSGALSDRFGTRPLSVVGLFVLLVGYYALSTLDVETSAAGFVLRFLPIGVGMGTFQSPNNSAIMGTAPRERLGVASGLLAITRTLGQTAGIAALGALWAARVFHHAGGVLPGGATEASAVAQVAALQDTFHSTVLLMAVALGLGVWGLARERRGATDTFQGGD